jgi:hypothetical protein
LCVFFLMFHLNEEIDFWQSSSWIS